MVSKSRGYSVFTLDFGLLVETHEKKVNDHYIELLQIGWFTEDTKIGFRLGYNQPITPMLEDSNLSYILDNYKADLTRHKIQSTDTATAIWLGELIQEQVTLEAI